MIRPELLHHLHEIDEQLITEAAEYTGGNNLFHKLLFHAEIYRNAELEPIYLATADLCHYVVTCRETLGKKLH